MNRWPLTLLLTVSFPSINTFAGPVVINFRGLLLEMLDRSRIAEFPEPAFVCKQASSYNRKSRVPGQPEWFCTDDYSEFYGVEEVDGRREWILMDVDGPGAIVPRVRRKVGQLEREETEK